MQRVIIIALCAVLLSSCAAQWAYVKAKINPDDPSQLIGYRKMELRDDAQPEVVIDFNTNSWALNESAYVQLDAIISLNRRYLIEGTAGGFTGSALTLSRKRTKSVIAYLEVQGIASNKILIADYDPEKTGRQVRVYTITRN